MSDNGQGTALRAGEWSRRIFLHAVEGHFETAIAGAATVAGMVLLRQSGVDFSALAPGTLIPDESLDEAGAELLDFLGYLAAEAGIEQSGAWFLPVPPGHGSHLGVLALGSLFETAFLAALEKRGAPPELHAHIAAVAALGLVQEAVAAGAVDASTGMAIVMHHLVAGSKTVPPSK